MLPRRMSMGGAPCSCTSQPETGGEVSAFLKAVNMAP